MRPSGPPSKSLLQRALIGAGWSGQSLELQFPAGAPSWEQCGLDVARLAELFLAQGLLVTRAGDRMTLRSPGLSELGEADWQLGESGTSARLLLGLLAFAGRPKQARVLRVEGTLRSRACPALLQSLRLAGVSLRGAPTGSGSGTSHAPHCEAEHPWPVHLVSTSMPQVLLLENPRSSQEVSALLFSIAMAGRGEVWVKGPIPSLPYVQMSMTVLQSMGILLESITDADGSWRAWVTGDCAPEVLPVESDASAAAVAWAAGLLARKPVSVFGIPGNSAQGDLAMLDYLRAAGASVEPVQQGEGTAEETASESLGSVGAHRADKTGWRVTGGLQRGWKLDLTATPDLAPPLVALAAALAHGHFGAPHPSEFIGLAGLENKESPRLTVLCETLRSLGLSIECNGDRLRIASAASPNKPSSKPMSNVPGKTPGSPLRPTMGSWDARSDHRMAFAFALLGFVWPEQWAGRVSDEDCVAKSWPDFWDSLDRLRTE